MRAPCSIGSLAPHSRSTATPEGDGRRVSEVWIIRVAMLAAALTACGDAPPIITVPDAQRDSGGPAAPPAETASTAFGTPVVVEPSLH